jgi:hypothetical protein
LHQKNITLFLILCNSGVLQSQFIGCLHIFQVESIADIENGPVITVVYMQQPYKAKPGLWRFHEDQKQYIVALTDIIKILQYPVQFTHRTGDMYYFFEELE